MEIILEEIFKDIQNYEGLYQISNYGNVKSVDRYVLHKRYGNMHVKECIMKCFLVEGYLYVRLCKNSKHKTFKIHRIVMTHFVLNPNNFLEVNHIDGVKTNNHIDNLEWCTRSHNEKHAHKIGLKNFKGKNAPNIKLTEEKIKEIKELLKNKIPQRTIAKKYDIAPSTVNYINTEKKWKYVK